MIGKTVGGNTAVMDSPVSTTETTGGDGWAAIIFNDDVNSFDHVIQCLVIGAHLNKEKAEMTARIAHESGEATVGIYSEAEATRIVKYMTINKITAETRKLV